MKFKSLAVKIGGGFALVLSLLMVVSVVSWYGLNSMTQGFISYRGLARDTNLAGRLQANMLMVRMNAKNFVITGNSKDISEYQNYKGKMQGFLDTALEEIQNPARSQKINMVSGAMKEYENAFNEIVKIRSVRDKLVKESLNVYGPNLEKLLAEMVESAQQDGYTDVAYEVGIALKHVLLGRLYALKFLDTNAPAEFERVDVEFKQVFEEVGKLEKMLIDESRLDLLGKVKGDAKLYFAAFKDLSEVIYKRNSIIAQKLDKIGPLVAKNIEDVKLSVKAEQDALGPKLEKQSGKSIKMLLVISLLALVVGIIISVVLARVITGPIHKVVDFVQQLAGGNFKEKLRIDQDDEIGVMCKALNEMVTKLGKVIGDISNGIGTLSSSSVELSNVSEQLMTASRETSETSNTVISSAEEMSRDISSVSSAMEQSSANTSIVASATEDMSSSIEDIHQRAGKARDVSTEAVTKSQETSSKMSMLGESANKISKVTEAINEISEQTNLLALNATIEAARAGEAGKGFAVVANEIKDLAQQTASATVDIKQQIGEMQSITKITVDDMDSISKVINDINAVIISIASSVEEQSATTREIAGNVNQVSVGIVEVNGNVSNASLAIDEITKEMELVHQATGKVDQGSSKVQSSAEDLSNLAGQLKDLVKNFKI